MSVVPDSTSAPVPAWRLWLLRLAFIGAGIIHLLPVSGVLGAEKLAALYGIAADDAGLVLLLRHRAVLFGLLGLLLVAAAFRPALQNLALGAGLVSVVSFLLLAGAPGQYGAGIGRVISADIVALVLLLIAALLRALPQPRAEADHTQGTRPISAAFAATAAAPQSPWLARTSCRDDD